MTAERYFRRLIYTDLQINTDLAQIEKMKALLQRVPEDTAELEKTRDKFKALENRIAAEIDELIRLEDEALEVLQQIENPQQRIVLQEYYINGQSLETIAGHMYLTYRRVQDIKKQGLTEAQRILNRSKDSI